MAKKKAKTAKIVLIVLGLSLLLFVAVFSIPLVIGMSHGYDSALIEGAIKKGCNCETVEFVKPNRNSEKLAENFSSGNFNIPVTLQLTECDYANIEDLMQDVNSKLNEKQLCIEKTILISVKNFKGEDKEFSIANCQFNQESE